MFQPNQNQVETTEALPIESIITKEASLDLTVLNFGHVFHGFSC